MPTIHDSEFGDINVRRSHLATQMKITIAPNGTLRVSMPKLAPLFLAKRLIASSRESIRASLKPQEKTQYRNGQQIGKSHSIEIILGQPSSVKRHGQRIVMRVQNTEDMLTNKIQSEVRAAIIQALRREASSYLPKRLDFLAKQYGFSYTKARFSHASSRWGSCSSNGTISLNIALMRLPFELIDYVIIHELCHTVEMNHSDRFWKKVGSIDKDYVAHRRTLKKETPTVR